MTNTPPEFVSPYPADRRLGVDLSMTPAYQPKTFPDRRTGHGRWCLLYAQGGQVALGYLWHSDAGGLGFVPSSREGVTRVPEFYKGFSAAAKAGSTARVVFDDYAARAGLGLSAGPVTEGDLDTLPE